MATLGKRVRIEESESDDFTDDDLEKEFGFETKKVENWFNRQRVLVACSRGVGSRSRHLVQDLLDMLPHCKKEV